jgi:hypothetical protein
MLSLVVLATKNQPPAKTIALQTGLRGPDPVGAIAVALDAPFVRRVVEENARPPFEPPANQLEGPIGCTDWTGENQDVAIKWRDFAWLESLLQLLLIKVVAAQASSIIAKQERWKGRKVKSRQIAFVLGVIVSRRM